jgi:hydrogenase nickel incorporation protein HypA/HybF
MHELSLACSLIEEAEKVLEAENAGRVICLTVGIGRFAGIETEAFEFAFPAAAAGTRLEKAALTIEDIPAAVRCRTCGKESNPAFPRCACAHCDSDDVELLHGREFVIKSMEIE